MTDPVLREQKSALRRSLLARRRARSVTERDRARAALRGHLVAACATARSVCAYLPLPTEPLPPEVLTDLVDRDIRVLVPVTGRDEPLDWVDYPCPTMPGPFGVATPVGDRRGPAAISLADIVLVPALAVDGRGNRLGRGGGHYDRSLALLPARPTARLIAVLFDDELLPAIPVGEWDVPVTAAIRPATGLQSLL